MQVYNSKSNNDKQTTNELTPEATNAQDDNSDFEDPDINSDRVFGKHQSGIVMIEWVEKALDDVRDAITACVFSGSGCCESARWQEQVMTPYLDSIESRGVIVLGPQIPLLDSYIRSLWKLQNTLTLGFCGSARNIV